VANRTVVGIFDSLQAAERAKKVLVKGGIVGERIAVSWENQPRQSANDSAWARYGELLRIGLTLVSVEAPSKRERMYIEDLMKRNGARETAERPPARRIWRG
jgi:hypothetical protein